MWAPLHLVGMPGGPEELIARGLQGVLLPGLFHPILQSKSDTCGLALHLGVEGIYKGKHLHHTKKQAGQWGVTLGSSVSRLTPSRAAPALASFLFLRLLGGVTGTGPAIRGRPLLASVDGEGPCLSPRALYYEGTIKGQPRDQSEGCACPCSPSLTRLVCQVGAGALRGHSGQVA